MDVYQQNLFERGVIAYDDFAARTTTSPDFGTASDGETWVDSGSGFSDGNIYVSGRAGRFNSQSARSRTMILGTRQIQDAEAVVRVTMPDVSGGSLTGILLRHQDYRNFYSFHVDGVNAVILKRVADVNTTLVSVALPQAMVANWVYGYYLRARIQGANLYLRTWRGDFPESAFIPWTCSATDSTYTSGGFGFRAYNTSVGDALCDSFSINDGTPVVTAKNALWFS